MVTVGVWLHPPGTQTGRAAQAAAPTLTPLPPQVVGPFADNPRVLFGDYAPVPEPQYIYTPR